MKCTLSKLSLSALLLLTFSCKNPTKTDDEIMIHEEKTFSETKIQVSKFKRVGNSFQYCFKGDAKNLSSNIFDKVYVTIDDVELILENGNVITEKDYQSAVSFTTGFGDLEKSWKPNEIRKIGSGSIDILNSDYIPDHYKDYPIVKVNAIIKYSCQDLINRTELEYFSSVDITNIWKECKK